MLAWAREQKNPFFQAAVVNAAQEMVEAARFFHSRGWLLGTCGNLSARAPEETDRWLVSPSGRDKSRLESSDFLLADDTGSSPDGKVSEEFGVHLEIYRRTAAGSVLHVHSVWNNLASHLWRRRGFVRFKKLEMIKGLAGCSLDTPVHLPIVENSNDMETLSASVAGGLDLGVPAVLVHQHGIYVWGKDPLEARRHVEVLEFMLEYVVRRRSLKA